jgi:hypothetical protein
LAVAFCERMLVGAMWNQTAGKLSKAWPSISRFSSKLAAPPQKARARKVKPIAIASGVSGAT